MDPKFHPEAPSLPRRLPYTRSLCHLRAARPALFPAAPFWSCPPPSTSTCPCDITSNLFFELTTYCNTVHPEPVTFTDQYHSINFTIKKLFKIFNIEPSVFNVANKTRRSGPPTSPSLPVARALRDPVTGVVSGLRGVSPCLPLGFVFSWSLCPKCSCLTLSHRRRFRSNFP